MSAIANIFKVPELTRRIGWTLGLLAVYRMGVFLSIPGVNRDALKETIGAQPNSLVGVVNMFSGGAFEQASIFALGIMPYVSASIILQLMSVVIPTLAEARKEGEAGQRKINQYTRYVTIIIAIVQGIATARFVVAQNTVSAVGDVVRQPGPMFYFIAVTALATGTAFIMWLGEQITERGIGNGSSLIIFAGIVTDIPGGVVRTIEAVKLDQIKPVPLMLIGVIILAAIAVVIFFERGQRRIPVHYARRMVGKKMTGSGTSSHLPLRVNSAGVIPPIFASSLLTFPQTLAGIGVPYADKVAAWISPNDWIYNVLFVGLIIFFAYFYTSVTFPAVEIAENLKKQNAIVPGIRPGKATADHIDHVLSRITLVGAIYMAAVCILPTFLIDRFHAQFYFGGTSVMIVVGVALDTVQQIESYLITRHYEGLTGAKGPRIRGRRG